MKALAIAAFAVVAVVSNPIADDPAPLEPDTCDGHAHSHTNSQHKAFVRRLYRNPWLPKKARAKHRHMLACAETSTHARLMRKRWRIAKSPVRGIPVPMWRRWSALGRCEQPGPGRWGVWWSAHPYGEYQGGLGFYRQTWLYYRRFAPGGSRYPDTAAHATWREQMRVAEAILREVGWGWGCSG